MTKKRKLALERLENRYLLTGGLFRSFDGTGNNLANEEWGSANTPLLRLTTVEYGSDPDPGDFPPLADRVDSDGNTINPRTVSNLVFDQDADAPNNRGLSSFIFQWGQFLDHDMDLTEDPAPVGVAALPGENISFFAPSDDEELDPGTMIPQLRSRYALDDDGVAQQINQITSFIDASNVYGSDGEKAEGLRTHYGGFLLTSDGISNTDDGTGNFLPFNTLGLENASPPTTGTGVPLAPEDFFVAGDVRSNEQPGLTTLHTLFVREHNYQAHRIADRLGLDAEVLAAPDVDEYIYQMARQIVGAEVQAITYNEFLPALLGPDQLASYGGYQADVNASIANIFSASLYRVGHTMLPNELLLLNEDGSPVPDNDDVLGASVENGQVALGEAFFNPALLTTFGVEPYLKGLAEQQIQEIDSLIVDGVRNLLFDPPAAVDLGATNLQRGRDHGLADYNQTRIDFGLAPMTSFAGISSGPGVAATLAAAYDGDVNNIDVFAAAISEDPLPGGSVGQLMQTVLADQFARLRDGDRFYYENIFHGRRLENIQNTLLSDIIRRNTTLENIQDEVFRSERVFVFRGLEGAGHLDVTLRLDDGEIQVVDKSGVVASQSLDDTDIIVIFGTSHRDRITMAPSAIESLINVPVELHGNGGSDTLVVNGTDENDVIKVMPTEIRINENLSLYYGNFETVDVRARGGDDEASVVGKVGAQLILSGGLGDDTLTGGRGSQILMGGAGADTIRGGRGRDLIIGGVGGDTLYGNRGQDILIAGRTAFDNNDRALQDILSVWRSNLSYDARVDELSWVLRSQGPLQTVFDDADVDYLEGGLARDWFFFQLGFDSIGDQRSNERHN